MRLVIDASVAIKWVIAEAGSRQAETLHSAERLLAPDLIYSDCANALWKLVRRGEFSDEQVIVACRGLEQAPLQLFSCRGLLTAALRLALALEHPAYDFFYLALAAAEACPLVTADERLRRRVLSSGIVEFPEVLSIEEAAWRLS
ncbi:MAG TPA: type II toxin-antitoxin system VapC family toxin [Caulobacteraceae bacterium]|nr:type II toxin-antitoxin system VapC family toxin [Caulobacteraceae bacterium]